MDYQVAKELYSKYGKFYARAEGWDIFDSEGSLDGITQVQAVDDLGLLTDDTEAWYIVMNGTLPHHEWARIIVKNENPLEYRKLSQAKIVA